MKISLQWLMPKRLLSKAVGRCARARVPVRMKNAAIRWFIQRYGVDMSQAARPLSSSYSSFEDFFTRELKPLSRRMPENPLSIACPADGSISRSGSIENGMLIQTKGHRYSASELIGRDSETYEDGTFASVYLAPRDYHRVHVPIGAELVESVWFPGELFSVNTASEARIPRLFCQNERVAFHFRIETGPLCVVMIAALIVAGIKSPYAPVPGAGRSHQPIRKPLSESLARGAELGRFAMGSTVILLVSAEAGQIEEFPSGKTVRLGDEIGAIRSPQLA